MAIHTLDRPSAGASSRFNLHSGYIPFLDGLRAIAVLMVIPVHIHSQAWRSTRSLIGWLGVMTFFVLSGYLITSLALREEERFGALSLPAFYIRRTFRIFPLYYTVLGIYIGLILGTHGFADKKVLFLHALPFYLTYLQEIPFVTLHSTAPFYHSWSLGIEEKFYIIWPVAAFAILRGAKRLRFPIAFLLAATCPFMGPYLAPYTPILLGCSLAIALQNEAVCRAFRAHPFAVSLCSLALMALTTTAIILNFLPTSCRPINAIFFSGLLGCLALSVDRFNELLRSALSCRPLVFIGKVSYGIYLIHILCLNVIERVTGHNGVLTYLITVVLSTSIAYLLHRYFEQPLIETGRKLASAWRQKALRPEINDLDVRRELHGRGPA
jgi:peptidoglycan/LPS O-acetylase OafA/YrhL